MSGTTEGGKKSAAKVRQEYGPDAAAKWGAQGHKARKTNVGGLNDPSKVKEITAKGGSMGHRARPISVEGKLRPDEWGLLLKLINTTAGKIRLSGAEGMDAMEQHLIYHKVFDYWSKEDWVGAMMDISDHPMWHSTFAELLDETNSYYIQIIKGQPRRSEDREISRIYRNLTAAYRLAQKERNNAKAEGR